MKIGVISDVHSNIEALQATLAHLHGLGIRRIYNLGDMIGYGASPNEVIAELQRAGVISLLGNHDQAVLGTGVRRKMRSLALASLTWTKEKLTAKSLEYLRNLRSHCTANIDGLTVHFMHGTPRDPLEGYIAREVDNVFEYFSGMVGFVAGTHVGGIYSCINGKVLYDKPENRLLDTDHRWLIDVGALGQPRNGDTRAQCCTFETNTLTLTFEHVDYDVQAAYEKLIFSDLPPQVAHALAERLYAAH